MKKFYNMTLVCAALATASAVSAQNWEAVDQKFVDTYHGMAVAADFTGNGHYDFYCTGTHNTEWCKPFNFRIDGGEEAITALVRNNGDGTFSLDWNYPVNFEDPSFNSDSYVPGTPNNTYMRAPKHNIAPVGIGDAVALDYNNDGLVDILTISQNDNGGWWQGWWYFWDADCRDDEGNTPANKTGRRSHKLTLYKNLGDGNFEMVANHGFHDEEYPDHEASRSISVGDFDNDGYVDILVSGFYDGWTKQIICDEWYWPSRHTHLYRNNGKVGEGESQFSDCWNADVQGGVWTVVKTDDSGAAINEKSQLGGHFLPVTGNVMFADINNDGWLDVVSSGWADSVDDGFYSGGNIIRIYQNVAAEDGSRRFKDITDMTEAGKLVGLDDGSVVMADVNKDGYLDFMTQGYCGELGGWKNLLYLNKKEGSIYNSFLTSEDTGLPGDQHTRLFLTDFDGDGNLDLYTAGEGSKIYYGDGECNFEADELGISGWKNNNEHRGTIGDFDGDGYADIYMPSERKNGDDGLALDPNPEKAQVYINKLPEGAAEAPQAPTGVDAVSEGGKTVITWNFDEAEAIANNLAYNIFVKFTDGSVYTILPADLETGFVRISESRQTALRPTLKSFTLNNGNAVNEVGVQTVSLNNFTSSKFTTKVMDPSGIGEILDDQADAPVKYFNIQGMEITNPQEGQIVIKVCGNKATKVVF